MNTSFQEEKKSGYISHTVINREEIIPSDTFDLGENEYVLLKIMKSTDGVIFLKIMGLNGMNTGNIYLIPKYEFESKTVDQMEKILPHYQH